MGLVLIEFLEIKPRIIVGFMLMVLFVGVVGRELVRTVSVCAFDLHSEPHFHLHLTHLGFSFTINVWVMKEFRVEELVLDQRV